MLSGCVVGSLRRTVLLHRCIASSKSHPVHVSRYRATHRSRLSRPITTGPGNSGTFPQAISAALCSAVLIFCGTLSSAFKYAAKYWYGNCFDRGSQTRQRSGRQRNQPSHLLRAHRVAAKCSSSYAAPADPSCEQCSPNLRSLGGIGQQVPSDVIESTSD